MESSYPDMDRSFYISMVLFKTLINRDMWMNPLCDVWGVWGIYRYNTVTGQRILTSECIENFFLLMPYIILMFWNFEEKIFGKKVYIGKIILKSIQIAFLSSLTFEMSRYNGNCFFFSEQCYNGNC